MFAKFNLAMICTLLSLVACWATPVSANLLTNPGFEASNSTLEDWTTFAFTSSPQVDTTMPRTGSNAFEITAATSSTGSSGIFYNGPSGARTPVIPGGSYTASIYAKAGSVPNQSDDVYGGANIRLIFRDATGATIDSSPLDLDSEHSVFGFGDVITDSYVKYSVTDDVPAGAVDVAVGLYARHNSQAIFWDDADLEFTAGVDTPVMELTIDRATGNISIDNTGTGDADIRGYTLTSNNGSFDSLNWTSVAGNYDTSGGSSNGSVDNNDAWTRLAETSTSLNEREDGGGDGGVITIAQAAVDLGDNLWVQSPVEDVSLLIEFTDGSVEPGVVKFVGGPNGTSFERSDFNFDGSIDALDWPTLRDNLLSDVSGLSNPLAYQQGDLNGDGSNNLVDFGIFKADFDAVNGVGSLNALIASVPEPSSMVLLAAGVLGLSLSRKRKVRNLGRAACLLAIVIVAGVVAPSVATAASPVDFTTFTVDNYPLSENANFTFPSYTTSASTATLDSSANQHFFYGTQSILNKRIVGRINPGADDDYIGLALGYTAGDSTNPLPGAGAADFLLLDWREINQFFDIADDVILAGSPTFQFFHDQTAGGDALAGLALSRVSGTPTGDELWAHRDAQDAGNFDINASGGVTELQRGATLGSTGYTNNVFNFYDITYTSTNITVKIDGVEQINVSGSFPDGVLGLYSLGQSTSSAAPVYADFTISDLDELLTATVNTLSGSVTVSNSTSVSFDLNAYTLESASSSLDAAGWNSLQDQDLAGFGAGNGSGNGWEEGANSSDTGLVEASLTTSSTLGAGDSVSLGSAFDTAGSQDLVFTYRDPSGLLTTGIVNYVSTVENANFDGDADVDGADFLTWQRGFGTGTTLAQGDANASGSVDGADLAIWQSQHGATGLLSGVQSVPEPSSALLLVLAAFGLGMSRQKNA